MLGVPVRRVEAAAWFGSGLACGAAGLILPDLITSLDYSALTFLVISSLAAALIGRLRSLWVDDVRRPAVGPRAVDPEPVHERLQLPVCRTVRARDRRAALPVAPPRRDDLEDRELSLHERVPRARRGRASGGRARPARDRPLRAAAHRGRRLDHDLHERRHLLGGRARLRHPLRARRPDLARPGGAAHDRLLDRHAPRVRDLAPVPARFCCSRAASPARSASSSACRRSASRASISR